MGLSVFSLPEELRSALHKSNLRAAFDRYIIKSGHLRGWARFSLALSFLTYLTAAGIDKASIVTYAGAIVIAIILIGGTLLTIVGIRELSYEYRKSSIELKDVSVQFELTYKATREEGDKPAASASTTVSPADKGSLDTVIHVAAGGPASPS